MKNSLFILIIATLSMLSFSRCSDNGETEDIRASLVGTWQLTAVEIDDQATDITSSPAFVRFQSNQIYLSYDATANVVTHGGWSYEGNMLNISVDLPAAYYVLHADAATLSLKRYDFNADGNLRITIRKYQRTDDAKIPN
jgi:hypothetical protein